MVSIEILSMLNLTDEVAVELANLGMISLSLKLINQQEYKVQYHAAFLFFNITSRTGVLRQIMANEDFDTLIEAVVKAGTREVRLMYLKSIKNLILIEDAAPEMVRHGLLEVLVELFAFSPDIEIGRIAANIIDMLCLNEVLVEKVFNTVKIGDLVSRMLIDRDLETARYAFHITKQFSKYPALFEGVMIKKVDIAAAVMTCLKDKTLNYL